MILELSAVSAGYRGVNVVKRADLRIRPGELVLITGPNGCGKSTLVRAIIGLLPLSGGVISLNGVDVSDWRPWRRARAGMAYGRQGGSVFLTRSVQDNLEAAFRFLRRDGGGAADRDIVRELTVLAEKRHTMAGDLSGGERQLLSFARVVLSRPTIALLDEPLAGVDAFYAAAISHMIAQLRARGVAFVVVEHEAGTQHYERVSQRLELTPADVT